MTALCAALFLLATPQAEIKVGRYDMGERLKKLDVTWMNVTETERRKAGVEQVRQAVVSFFGMRYGEACARLDAATAALRGSEPTLSQAVSIRFVPPVVRPGKQARLVAYWAYQPENATAVRIGVGSTFAQLEPGSTLEMMVDPPVPAGVSAEASEAKEYGILVNVAVGSETQTAYLTIADRVQERTKALLESTNDTSRAIARQINSFLEKPESSEQDFPVLDHLSMAEDIDSNKRPLWNYTHIPLSFHRNTHFRVAFPKSLMSDPALAPEATVVIAFHGAGGSENLFFEGYGRGIAPSEAIKRGWVFIAPRASGSAPEDVYDWLVNVRKLKIKRIFAMGHSMGGAEAVRCVTLPTPSSGVALFAPAAAGFATEWTDQPMFYTVGAQEIPGILRNARNISRILAPKPKFEYKEYDPCEHLMIVATAAKDAYAFFDRYNRPSP